MERLCQKLLSVKSRELLSQKSFNIDIWQGSKYARSSSHWRCSVKKVFLKISQIPQENTCVGEYLEKTASDTSL